MKFHNQDKVLVLNGSQQHPLPVSFDKHTNRAKNTKQWAGNLHNIQISAKIHAPPPLNLSH